MQFRRGCLNLHLRANPIISIYESRQDRQRKKNRQKHIPRYAETEGEEDPKQPTFTV